MTWLAFVRKYQRKEEYEFDAHHILIRLKLPRNIEATVEETIQFESLDFEKIGRKYDDGRDGRNFRAIGRQVAKGQLLFHNYREQTRYVPK